MARQVGDIKVVGTMDNLCFYEMEGQYYVRMKPGLDRKQFFKSAKYAPQREASKRMILSARVASLIYKQIPTEKKEYKVCCALQKQAALLMKGGVELSDIIEQLGEFLVEEGCLNKREAKKLRVLATDPVLNEPQRSKWVRKDVDHFKGVHIRSKDGRWFRLYHRDELRLLEQYEERIAEGDETWLSEFLVRRKKLPTYRLRHKKRRRKRVVSEVVGAGCNRVERRVEVKGVSVVGNRQFVKCDIKRSKVRRVSKRPFRHLYQIEDPPT